MAEKKKKKGLLERATDYVTDAATKYMAGRRRMSERLENPTAPPRQEAAPEPGSQPPDVIPMKLSKKKKKEGGVGAVMGTVKERKKRMKQALDM